jgi:hypothetical protein
VDLDELKRQMHLAGFTKTRRSELAETKLFFEGKKISFEDFKFSKQIIDTKAPSVVLKCGRQTAKSVSLGTVIITSLVTSPYKQYLYVSPTTMQTSVFSSAKIQARLNESPAFSKLFVDKTCTQNVKEKSFVNDARIYFRAATQLEAIRGLAVHVNFIDEIQDIPLDYLSIIEETMSGQKTAPESWYAGTPKTIHNGLQIKWDQSNQMEPVLVCPAGHHDIANEEMIKPDALRCVKCKEKYDLTIPSNSFLFPTMPQNEELAGFWIPQIALPRHVHIPAKWKKLVQKKENYSPEHFKNEVMGLSAGSGAFLIQERHLVHACKSPFEFPMWEEGWQPNYLPGVPCGIRELWGGLDWGHTAERSFTIFMVGGYDIYTKRFVIVFAKKFYETNPLVLIDEIAYLADHYNIQMIIPDYGGGWTANELLASKVSCPVIQCIYAGERLRFTYDVKAQMFKAARSRSMIDSFNQIKEGRIHFYEWPKFRELAKMFLAIFQESSIDNKGNVVTKFNHATPDDAFHAYNLLFQAWKFKNDPAGHIFPG